MSWGLTFQSPRDLSCVPMRMLKYSVCAPVHACVEDMPTTSFVPSVHLELTRWLNRLVSFRDPLASVSQFWDHRTSFCHTWLALCLL